MKEETVKKELQKLKVRTIREAVNKNKMFF